MVTVDLVTLTLLSLCPCSLLIGAFLGAILTVQLLRERNKEMVRINVTIRGGNGEWESKVVPLLQKGWVKEGITPSDIQGFVEVHLARRM